MNPGLLPENITAGKVGGGGIHLLFQTGARFLPAPLPDVHEHIHRCRCLTTGPPPGSRKLPRTHSFNLAAKVRTVTGGPIF